MLSITDDLLPLGKAKVVAIISEFVRVDGELQFSNDWLYWLVRVLFVPTKPDTPFPFPAIFSAGPEPGVLQDWPTYPVIIVDDIPINLNRETGGGGFPEPFEWYFRAESVKWSLRQKPLRPLDDPFTAIGDIESSPFWNTTYVHARGYSYAETDQLAPAALQSVLDLIRTAYRSNASDDRLEPAEFLAKTEVYHKACLKLGCHFDPTRGIYVRGDGTTLPDD